MTIICTYDRDKILGDDFIESHKQMLDLILDGRVQSVLGRQLDKLSLVLLSDRDGCAAFFQVNNLCHAKLSRVCQHYQ